MNPERPAQQEISDEVPPISAEIIVGLARDADFCFELRIGRELRSVPGAQVRHGETYIDHRTEKEREFDYQFRHINEHRRVQLAVECKNIFHDSPVVVCGQRRAKTESFHDLVCAATGVLRPATPHGPIQSGEISHIFGLTPSGLYPTADPASNFVGKSIFRPKPPTKEKRMDARKKSRPLPFEGYAIAGDDDGYDAWNQSLGSAADLALQSLTFKPAPYEPTWLATVTLPVVVVPNGTLWQVEFSEDGSTSTPHRVERVAVFRDHRVRRMGDIGTPFFRMIRLPYVHFFTEEGLRYFLKTLANPDSLFWEIAWPEERMEDFVKRFSPNR